MRFVSTSIFHGWFVFVCRLFGRVLVVVTWTITDMVGLFFYAFSSSFSVSQHDLSVILSITFAPMSSAYCCDCYV